MKKSIKNLMMVAALVCGTMSMTSCDEIMETIFGEWDKPTPQSSTPDPTPTPTPDPESAVTTIELTTTDLTAEQKSETAALLAAAQAKGATIGIKFSYDGVDYDALFEKPDGEDYKLTSFISSQTSTIEETLKLASFTPYLTLLIPDDWTEEQIDEYIDSLPDEDEGDDEGEDEGDDEGEGEGGDDTNDSEYTDKIVITDGEGAATTRGLTRAGATSSALDMLVGMRTDTDEDLVQVQINTGGAAATIVGETGKVVLKSFFATASTSSSSKTSEGYKASVKVIVNGGGHKRVSRVTLSPKKLKFKTGNPQNIKLSFLPKNASRTSGTLYSEDGSIAKIAKVASGNLLFNVKPLKNGKTNIFADVNGKIKKCQVTVYIRVDAVSLNETLLQLSNGQTYRLKATVSSQMESTRTVTWKSSNKKVATVDENGLVTAVGKGAAIITATSLHDTSKKAECTVTVDGATTVAVESVSLNKPSLDLTIGDKFMLVATVSPSTATNQNVTWSSDKTSVATVDQNGAVKAVGVGEAIITVTTKDGSKTATCNVTVKAATVAVTGVSLDQTSLDLTVGGSATLKATVAPLDATNQNVTWESNNTAAATVDQNGAVKAVGVGEATITVTTEDGSKTDACTVKVSKKAGSISYPTAPVEKLTTDAAFTITLTKVGDGEVTYSSSDTDGKIVVVNSSSGEVTIKGAGEVKITATVRDSNTYHYATTTASYTLTVVKPNPAGGLEDYNKNNLNNW